MIPQRARLFYPVSTSLERLCVSCAAFVLLAGAFHEPLKSLYSLGFVRYYPWVILLCIVCVLPFLSNNEFFKRHDCYLLLFVLFASISSLLHGAQDISRGLSILIRYVLPVSMYFVFAHLNVSERYSHSIIIYFSIFLAMITIMEFLFQNLFGMTIFNYGGGYDVTAVGSRFHPWTSEKFIRARGSTQYAQITGCLHAALILYFLAFWFFRKTIIFSKKYSFLSYLLIVILIIISSISLYMTGSGTGLLVLTIGVCLLIYFRYNIKIQYLLLILPAFLMPVFFVAMDYGHFTGYYNQSFLVLVNSMKNYVGYINSDHLIDVLFGFRDYVIVSQHLSTETHLFNELVEIGFVSYFFLMLLLGNYFFVIFNTYRFNLENTLGLALIVLSLLIGSIHYECMFTFPANVLFFTAMGLSLRYNTRARKGLIYVYSKQQGAADHS